MSNLSSSEVTSSYNLQIQRLINTAEFHNPKTFNEESQRLLGEFFAREVESELISISFLVQRKGAPHWNPRRIVIPEPLYSIAEGESPIYRERAHIEAARLRPLVNLTMCPARDGKNLVAYWYSFDHKLKPNAVILPPNQPARIVTPTRLI